MMLGRFVSGIDDSDLDIYKTAANLRRHFGYGKNRSGT
jgi:hypothetical protein